MIQQQLTGLLIFTIITVGEAAFGTLPPRPTTGTIYIILYYNYVYIIILYRCETISKL